MTIFKSMPGSVTSPNGFLASGVSCGIKALGKGKGTGGGGLRDLAVIYSEVPTTVAGMFTTNQVCAAPVTLTQSRVSSGTARAIVVNSGNANACTGPAGLRDARAMASTTAGLLNVPATKILVASTGRIGLALPMPQVKRGIKEACAQLSGNLQAANNAAQAILTSDTRTKQIAVELQLGNRLVRLGGIAKGAGMIHPGMSPDGSRPASSLHATMLCFLTTDASIEAAALQCALTRAVAGSFNCISVDGDMSTNDTVLLLANGRAGNPKITLSRRKDRALFQAALDHVTLELAKMLVRDGEGVSRCIEIKVAGARTSAQAEAAARSVANSSLVKASWCGGDPNWGRIIDALGYSTAEIVADKISIGYRSVGKGQTRFARLPGRSSRTSTATLRKIVAQSEFELHLDLGLGSGAATFYASDLTEAYVDYNKGE